MAKSPAHKFGQIIGDLLEEVMTPHLQEFCDKRGLYLDKQGARGPARRGRKVTWEDKFGNSHDLDFVIERGGSSEKRGRPLAFIEAAWRRYTKHSRNKAQEIQGALLPIAEKHEWDKPFLGAVLAGVFTEGSLVQMRSSGFEVMLFPYETIIDAFGSIDVDVRFDEDTPNSEFERTVNIIENLSSEKWTLLKKSLLESNQKLLQLFEQQLVNTLDRIIDRIVLIPLHGTKSQFDDIAHVVDFVNDYDEKTNNDGEFIKYEVIVHYSNGDKIDAEFSEKKALLKFLSYIKAGESD